MTQATPASPGSPSARIDGIDCLRALAIFYVLMNHVNMRLVLGHVPYLKALPAQLAWALVWQGQRGVQIFFAVSGFLIASTSIRRWGSLPELPLREFYRIRFARIAPLLLALLAILSLLHLLQADHFVVSRKDGGLAGALWAAFTLRIGLLEATRGYLPANWDILWSLSVEELFYLVFPLLCVVCGMKFPRRWALVAVLLIFVVLGPLARTVFTAGNEVWQEYSYLGGMDAIALGCLAAMASARWPMGRKQSLAMLLGGAAVLAVCLTCTPQLRTLERLGLVMTLIAVATCMVCAAAAQRRDRVPGVIRPVLTLGRRSYEIYLTHMFVVFAFFDWFVRANKPMLFVWPMFAAVVVCATILGELIGRFFTDPANRWLRKR
jgi:peptidoglycan/LPS O-acetylase OafA/YrhL